MKTERHRRFSAWLANEIDSRGMSQSELGRLIGVPQGSVHHWISGRNVPKGYYCNLIADALNIDRDTVLAIAGHRPPKPTVDPLAPEVALMAKIERIAWTPAMVQLIGGMLDNLIALNPKVRKQDSAQFVGNPRTSGEWQ